MTSNSPLQRVAGLFCLLLALAIGMLLTGCPGSNGKGPGGKKPARSSYPPPQSPGVEFTKTSVGLPALAMDYIGLKDFSLAGAKKSRQIFFAVPTADTGGEIYVRDLRSGIRAKVASVDRLVPGSLTVDHEGKYLVYCRLRETSKYIDDPGMDTPKDIALVYRYDLASKAETSLFDFRDAAWLPYRNANLLPMASSDGQRVACLAYDNNLSILGYTCDRWLADYDRIKGGGKLKPAEIKQIKDGMISVFSERLFSDKLKEIGLSITPAAQPGEAERSAIIKLRDSLPAPSWALLLWEGGKSSLVPLKLPAGKENRMFTLSAVSASTLLVSTATQDPGNIKAEYFTLNAVDGSLSSALSINGVPMHLTIDEKKKELLMVYSPASADAKLENYSVLLRSPLGGGAPQELKFEHNFANIVDLSPDGTQMLAQDQFDRDLYLVDTSSGERQRLVDFVAGSEIGVFLPEGGDQGVFLENGILFRFDIPADPEGSEGWRGPDYFKEYDTTAREFLGRLGFTPGEGSDTSWEGREGIGLDEFAGVLFDPSHPDSIALLRYDLKRKGFDSLYFPNGYNMAAVPEMDRGEVDAYGAEEIARHALDKAGWLGPNAQLFQRGSGPLYDAKSNSFVFIFRDGYNLPESGPWVVNTEATLRVDRGTGRIAEMNLSSLEPVNEPVLKATNEELTVAVRNFKETPLPPQASVYIDIANKRLILARPRERKLGPAAYAMPGAPRAYYEIDVYLAKGGDILWTSRVDTETAEVLDQLYFMPSEPGGTGMPK